MTRFERWSVWVTTILTAVTGVGYFWAKYLTGPPEGWAVVNHPLEPWFLRAHILVSPLLLFAVGMIVLRHVWRHFRSGLAWGRRSGLLTGLALAPMVLTGYLIQVTTSAGWVRAMAISHIAFGFLYIVGIGLHQIATRRAPSGGEERRPRSGLGAPRAPRADRRRPETRERAAVPDRG